MCLHYFLLRYFELPANFFGNSFEKVPIVQSNDYVMKMVTNVWVIDWELENLNIL